MKILKDILSNIKITEFIGSDEMVVQSVHINSKEVKKAGLFVAVKGTQTDGHRYIGSAIDSGAGSILCEDLPENIIEGVSYIKVKDSSIALAQLAGNFYDHPSGKIKVIGITGTNGKSTVASLCYDLFKSLGYKVGLISTIVYKIHDKSIEAVNTTPNVLVLNSLFDQMLEEGCSYCFMEVSSHAIHQKRVEGINFEVAAFTNLSHDHLDYHKDFKDYLNTKKLLFDNLSKDAVALTNADDKNGLVMTQNSKATIKTYAIKSLADFKGRILENSFRGLLLNFNNKEFHSLLIGKFNAYNLLAVYSIATILDIEEMEILKALSGLKTAEGRLDVFRLENENIIGFVDYAHSPDAVLNVLSTVNEIREGNGNLISVLGCGGNRDKAKRPVMTEIACKLSNKVIVTADNPRDEEIDDIIKDMLEGIEVHLKKKIITINNRREAIRTACHFATNGDIIAILGKGHEKYQEIKGEKIPFDDKEILINALTQENA